MGLNASLGFKKLPDPELIIFATIVIQRMTEDPKYTVLKTYVDTIKVNKEVFSAAISSAALGGKDRKDDKNAARAVLIKSMVSVTRHLEEMADANNDNPRIITDAGFEVRNTERKEKEPVKELETPIISAKNVETRTGAAIVTSNRVPNAINYAFRHKKMSETVWQNGNYDNKGEFTYTNLESGNVYEFQVCAQGENGLMSNWGTSLPIYVS